MGSEGALPLLRLEVSFTAGFLKISGMIEEDRLDNIHTQ